MNILENKPFSSPACKSIANGYGASCIEIIIYGRKPVDAGTDKQMLKQHKQQSFDDTYIALILEEGEKLYNKLTTKLRVIAATAS